MPKEDDRESRVTLIAAIIIAAKCAMGSPGTPAPTVTSQDVKPGPAPAVAPDGGPQTRGRHP